MRIWKMCLWMVCLLTALCSRTISAHDSWLETNTPLVRLGEMIHLDLNLGNHGNDHRDFKLAGKVPLESTQLIVTTPAHKSFDLKPGLIDTGLSPKEGYWTCRYTAFEEGLHVVSATTESLRGKTRSIKSAKTYFAVSRKLDDVKESPSHIDKPLGHPLEIMPLSNPATTLGAGQPVEIKLLYQSKPLAGARVSFIPRGTLLKEGFDDTFERRTDEQGGASFTPDDGNVVLIVVHHVAADEKGDGYDSTSYSSTLTVIVPQLCPECVKTLISD